MGEVRYQTGANQYLKEGALTEETQERRSTFESFRPVQTSKVSL